MEYEINLKDIKERIFKNENGWNNFRNVSIEEMDWLVEQADKAQAVDQQWYLLKMELESRLEFEERCNGENEINLIHDIQSLMARIESGEYFK